MLIPETETDDTCECDPRTSHEKELEAEVVRLSLMLHAKRLCCKCGEVMDTRHGCSSCRSKAHGEERKLLKVSRFVADLSSMASTLFMSDPYVSAVRVVSASLVFKVEASIGMYNLYELKLDNEYTSRSTEAQEVVQVMAAAMSREPMELRKRLAGWSFTREDALNLVKTIPEQPANEGEKAE